MVVAANYRRFLLNSLNEFEALIVFCSITCIPSLFQAAIRCHTCVVFR